MRARRFPGGISRRRAGKGLILLFVFLALTPGLSAQNSNLNSRRNSDSNSTQSSPRNSTRSSTQTVAPNILPDTQSSSEFPLWARDLRRGEIIAFGSFPFTIFISTLTMDSIRYFRNDRDSRYLPWPLKGPGAIEMTKEEREKTLLIAAAASVAIAAIDFTIVHVKRNRERARIERQAASGGTVGITRSPIPEEEPEEDVPETGDDVPESGEEVPGTGEPEESP